ncbi:hypothetical protein [Psychroserpens luteus]|uniref:Beta-lactamase-inhibitor-like, PepSY-like n=1 Tax=Psychroserpens luteus TaxID=1434066 RepID=A0ABW5ZWC1_9FLAO|nr:hypothetical protein [Psychroserpens luteus]
MILYFIPFIRIGDFTFESKINNYKSNFKFAYTPVNDSTEWETYEIEDLGLSLYVEEDNITSIVCRDDCLYKGRNLIGMTIEEFISHTEEKYYGEIDILDYEDDGVPQYVYEFDDIGLQVWCKNNIIVTIIASPEILDEEE